MKNAILLNLLLCTVAFSQSFADEAALDVTYIANEGFLISSGSKAVLVDALFDDPAIDFCDVPPRGVLEKMEKARDPFHEVDVVLVTHSHYDHFAARSAAAHMQSNPRCVLIGPAQAVEKLREQCPDFDSFSDRVEEVSVEPNSSREFRVNDIRVQALRMQHCEYMETDPATGKKRNRHAKVENLVYVVDMGAGSFLHMGDAVLQLNEDYVRSLDLEKRRITVAFVEFFDCSPAAQAIIEESIDPEHIVFMHFPPDKETVDRIGARLRQAFPDAVIFENAMDRKQFVPAGLTLEAVLDRVRKAIGFEKIAAEGRHLTIRSKTKDSGGHESVVETTFSVGGRFVQTTSGSVDRICGFDGSIPWVKSWGTTRRLALAERESNLVGMWLRTNHWLDRSAPLELTLKENDDPEGPILVELNLEDGIVPWTVQIDRSTWLPVAASRTVVGRETVIGFDDYRDHDGWMVPHRVTVHAYGKMVRESSTESVSQGPAIPDARYAPRLGPPDDTRFDPDLPSALNIKRGPYGDRLLIRPLFNGKDVGWFLFDTGAAGWTISTAAAEKAGLEVIGESPTTGTGGFKIEMKTCRTRSIRLGPATFENQIVRAIANAGLGGDCVGLVGFGLFARCVVEYDDVAGTISIHDPQKYKPRDIFWQQLVPGQIVPTIEASFEGHTELFRVDTGANSALVFNTTCVERLGLLDDRETRAIQAGGIDGEFSIERGKVDWIEFGGQRFTSVPAEFSTRQSGVLADPYTAGIICNDLLREFQLVIDYPRDRIGFMPRGQ